MDAPGEMRRRRRWRRWTGSFDASIPWPAATSARRARPRHHWRLRAAIRAHLQKHTLVAGSARGRAQRKWRRRHRWSNPARAVDVDPEHVLPVAEVVGPRRASPRHCSPGAGARVVAPQRSTRAPTQRAWSPSRRSVRDHDPAVRGPADRAKCSRIRSSAVLPRPAKTRSAAGAERPPPAAAGPSKTSRRSRPSRRARRASSWESWRLSATRRGYDREPAAQQVVAVHDARHG